METIIKLITKPDKFKTYRLIYKIKDLLIKHDEEHPEELCKMCFLYCCRINGDYDSSDSEIEDDTVVFINRHGDNYTYNDVCFRCKSLDIDIGEILLFIYKFEKPRLKEIIDMSKIKNPYSILLYKYENGYNHTKCNHYIHYSNDWDGPEPCPMVLELIDNLTDITNPYWIRHYDVKYIDYFLKKGCMIDLMSIVSDFVDKWGNKSSTRLDKVIKFCDAEIIKTALYSSAGKNCDPDKIKYLMKIGINFENHYLPSYDKMLFDTRLGKLIKSLNRT